MKIAIVTDDSSKANKWARRVRNTLFKYRMEILLYNINEDLELYGTDADKYIFLSSSHLNSWINLFDAYLGKHNFKWKMSKVFLVAPIDHTETWNTKNINVYSPKRIKVVWINDLDREFTWWPYVCAFIFGARNCIQNTTISVYFPWVDKHLESLLLIQELTKSFRDLCIRVTKTTVLPDCCVIIGNSKWSEVRGVHIMYASVIEYQLDKETGSKDRSINFVFSPSEVMKIEKIDNFGASESLSFVLNLMVQKSSFWKKQKLYPYNTNINVCKLFLSFIFTALLVILHRSLDGLELNFTICFICIFVLLKLPDIYLGFLSWLEDMDDLI